MKATTSRKEGNYILHYFYFYFFTEIFVCADFLFKTKTALDQNRVTPTYVTFYTCLALTIPACVPMGPSPVALLSELQSCTLQSFCMFQSLYAVFITVVALAYSFLFAA